MRRRHLLLALLGAATLPADAAPPKSAGSAKPRTIDWLDLLLPKDRATGGLRQHPPASDYLTPDNGEIAPQEQNFDVNAALDGMLVRIPGFIVPLDSDGTGKLKTFLLVPYMGACIHLPPPPPNQIVQVTLATPIAPTSIYAGYWVTGLLTVRRAVTRYGAVGWGMSGTRVDDYTY
jgi:hypothetical protein